MDVFATALRLAAMGSRSVLWMVIAPLARANLTALPSTLVLCSNWLDQSASPFTNSHHRIVSKFDNLDPFGFQPTGMLHNGRYHEIT